MNKFSRTRSSTGRQANSSEKAFEGIFKSPAWLLRFGLHCLFCFAALTLGFRLTRDSVFVIVPFKTFHGTLFSKNDAAQFHHGGSNNEAEIEFPYVNLNQTESIVQPLPEIRLPPAKKSSRVHVGRHEILVRSWPHPDPVQSVVAHHLLDLVQNEQRVIYSSKKRKQLLVITPTFIRTFQGVHLTSLIHTLGVAPGPLMWIVVEAGGTSNETASLLASSRLAYHHLSIPENMPEDVGQRSTVEAKLRLEGLRYIQEQQMDGVVLFADDSNTHTLDLFEEAQRVEWIGTFSIGFLSGSDSWELDAGIERDYAIPESQINANFSSILENNSISGSLPVQGPACGSQGDLIGWYIPSAKSGRSLEWSGFALNARIFWTDFAKPMWIRDFNEFLHNNDASIKSPLDFVTNASNIEPLGDCGKEVLVWWLRVEARSDSKFPSRWIISPPLEVVVPWKHTSWSDTIRKAIPPPIVVVELPDQVNQQGKQKSKGRKRGRGRKREKGQSKTVGDQFFSNRTQQN